MANKTQNKTPETPSLLESEVVPPKKSGRKPKETNPELVSALAEALKDRPVEDGRPKAFGPTTDFDTEGKATAEARRYKDALTAEGAPLHKYVIRVRAVASPNSTDETEKFRWRIYAPPVTD